MGFIKDIIKDVAADVSIDTIGAALDTIIDASYIAEGLKDIASTTDRAAIRRANKLDAYQEKMEKQNPDNHHIWMMEESSDTKSSLLGSSITTEYNFFNVDGNALYTANIKQTKRSQIISLYDTSGNIIGSIAEIKSKLKNPFAVKNNEKLIELEVFFKGKAVGFITNAVWKGKWFLTWDIVGWGAIHRKVGINQIVTEDDELIAELTTKTFNSRKLTFLDIEDAERERAVILFALAINAYGNTK